MKDIEEIATIIVDSAIHVHRALGLGLLESAYQQCLAYELRNRKLQVDCEVILPVVYERLKIDPGYRIDLLIDHCVIVENKAVEQILPIHEAQLLTYLKLGDFRLGFLLNWNVRIMKDGIKRFVRNLPEPEWREKSETLLNDLRDLRAISSRPWRFIFSKRRSL